MKLMRTIRFDPSDAQVFHHAAGSDEWAVPGGFTFAGLAEAEITGKLRQAFRNGFWSISSHGYSTFVAVAAIEVPEHSRLVSQLADHLVAAYGAPSLNAAIEAAASEIEFAADLCADLPINSLLTVQREFAEDGGIREAFRTVDPPGPALHARVWDVVEEQT